MTRSEWINIIGIAVAILTVCFLVIQQTGSIRSDLYRVESRLDAKIDTVEAKIDAVESRLETKIDAVEAKLEAKIDAVESRLGTRIDAVEAKLETKIDGIGTRFSHIEQNQARLEGEIGVIKEFYLESPEDSP